MTCPNPGTISDIWGRSFLRRTKYFQILSILQRESAVYQDHETYDRISGTDHPTPVGPNQSPAAGEGQHYFVQVVHHVVQETYRKIRTMDSSLLPGCLAHAWRYCRGVVACPPFCCRSGRLLLLSVYHFHCELWPVPLVVVYSPPRFSAWLVFLFRSPFETPRSKGNGI